MNHIQIGAVAKRGLRLRDYRRRTFMYEVRQLDEKPLVESEFCIKSAAGVDEFDGYASIIESKNAIELAGIFALESPGTEEVPMFSRRLAFFLGSRGAEITSACRVSQRSLFSYRWFRLESDDGHAIEHHYRAGLADFLFDTVDPKDWDLPTNIFSLALMLAASKREAALRGSG